MNLGKTRVKFPTVVSLFVADRVEHGFHFHSQLESKAQEGLLRWLLASI
jgi:hypothetical protein